MSAAERSPELRDRNVMFLEKCWARVRLSTIGGVGLA